VHHQEIKGMTKSALQVCLRYPWPGNVRELENVMERAVILTPGDFIVPESLPPNLQEGGLRVTPVAGKLTLDEALGQAEKQILLEALETYNWNRQVTARSLGISRTTLFNKMRQFEITDPRRKGG
jgi:TyrR family helix-turn-helix protein